MGLLNKSNEDKNNKKDSKVKKAVKSKVIVVLGTIGIKLIPLILAVAVITSIIEWVIKIFQPKNTVDEIYEKLEIDDVYDLIQIKGNEKDGYYLDFADGVDDKLEDTIEYLDNTAGVKSGIDKEFLKKMIKAEVCTQFPDLGGKIAENTSGFQGVVDILRITPNKEINSLKNTGTGKETVNDQAENNNIEITNKDAIDNQEKIIKSWSKGKELTLSATAFVYSQEDSKLHPGEKIDYWVPQKDSKTQENLKISRDTIVTYTGNYSISVDKMYNEGLIYVEIEKDDIKGYIRYNFIKKETDENNTVTDEEFENTGYTEIEKETVRDTIDSNVCKLTYIPKEKFDEYIKNANKDVLYNFTIDDEGSLITATWSTTGGSLELKNNSSINLKTTLQNYIIPYTYLMYFYIEADYKDFSSDLADEALNSKIIIALEDNVTTTNVKENVEEKKVSESSEFSYDWKSVDNKETTTEYCSTNIETIYADTWCVKLVNKDIYKEDLLSLSAGQPKNLKMPGTVRDTTSNSISEEKVSDEGTDTKKEKVSSDKNDDKEEKSSSDDKDNENGENQSKTVTKSYAYKIYQHTVSDTHSISNSYASSSKEIEPESKENVFINLYKTHQMYNRLNDKIFLEILENDSRTANLVNLTKYLMYMATGTVYDDIKEFDFKVFNLSNFNFVCDQYGGVSNIEGIPGKIYDLLLSMGVPPVGAAAAVGNIEGESTFDSTVVNSIGCSGLCQWGGDRITKLKALANSRGVSWTDVDLQLEYMRSELEGSYSNVKDVIMNAKEESDMEYATWYWGRYYEVFILGDNFESNKHKTQQRYEYAKKWYSEWKIKHTDGTVFYQQDYAYVPYGGASISEKGCGITSFAMVASDYSGRLITPEEAVDWCGDTYYSYGNGTMWSYFGAATKHFNLPCTCVDLGNNIDKAVEQLKSGNLVISAQSAGLFTSGGHFILLSSIDNNGGIRVRDPNKNNAINKGYKDRSFTSAEIDASGANYWAFVR